MRHLANNSGVRYDLRAYNWLQSDDLERAGRSIGSDVMHAARCCAAGIKGIICANTFALCIQLRTKTAPIHTLLN